MKNKKRKIVKRRDDLLGMARAGNNLSKAPLLINNNWAKSMSDDFSDSISNCNKTDSSEDLSELKRIMKKNKKHLG